MSETKYDIFISWHDKGAGKKISTYITDFFSRIFGNVNIFFSADLKKGVFKDNLAKAREECKLAVFLLTDEGSLWMAYEYGLFSELIDNLYIFNIIKECQKDISFWRDFQINDFKCRTMYDVACKIYHQCFAKNSDEHHSFEERFFSEWYRLERNLKQLGIDIDDKEFKMYQLIKQELQRELISYNQYNPWQFAYPPSLSSISTTKLNLV